MKILGLQAAYQTSNHLLHDGHQLSRIRDYTKQALWNGWAEHGDDLTYAVINSLRHMLIRLGLLMELLKYYQTLQLRYSSFQTIQSISLLFQQLALVQCVFSSESAKVRVKLMAVLGVST